jgi:hypothetical protein
MKKQEYVQKASSFYTRELVSRLSPFSTSSYLNPLALYLFIYDKIPNKVLETQVKTFSFQKEFRENFESLIKNFYYNKTSLKNSEKNADEDVYFLLADAMMLHVNHDKDCVSFFFQGTMGGIGDEIHNLIKSFKKKVSQKLPRIHILASSSGRLDLEDLELKRCTVDITKHYNDDFIPIDKEICKRLLTDRDKGIVLLHGAPGTGKTHYIKYLMTIVKKKVIFMPPNMAQELTNPALIGLLIENPNSILVIEDAEKIIMDRDTNGNSPVSTLLNLSDGLLSDCLNIQIICSFNTDLSKVDTALLRKGRLIAKYEFKELHTDKCNSLSKELGFSSNFIMPQRITDIFNQEEKSFLQAKRKSIGFN